MASAMELREASSVWGKHATHLRSHLSRVVAGKIAGPKAWKTRLARYGPTGRRPVDVRLRERLNGGPANAWRLNWSDWSI